MTASLTVPVSTHDAAVLQDYAQALKSFQTYFGDPIAEIEAILERDPDFVQGHLFRACAYYLTSERRYRNAAVESVARAGELISTANEREAMLHAAVDQFVAGNWRAASVAFDTVLQYYPADVFTLQVAHLMDFFRGDALNLRNRPGRVLAEITPAVTGYSYAQGMFAFGLEESNQYELAEAQGRAALSTDPADPWSVHAVTHVLEMLGRTDEGISFLEEREQDWAVDNGFAFHNWWHLGLMYLELRDDVEVLRLLDKYIFGDADDSLVLLDVTALLWRLRLIGVDVGDRFSRLAKLWADKVPHELGFYAFNDFHAALAFAACDRVADLEEVRDALTALCDQPQSADAPFNVPMTRDVGLPLVNAIIDYHAGQYDQAVRTLREVRDRAHMFGGSHAQRDLINLTLLSAAQKAGEDALVQLLLHERSLFKPSGILGQRVLQAA